MLSFIASFRYPAEQAFDDWLHIMQPIWEGAFIALLGACAGILLREKKLL